MTLLRYILRRFLVSILAVQAVIAVIVLLFSGIENLRRYAGNEDAGAADVAIITLLQAPDVLYQVFPLVVMLASLATFLGLARSSELVVLRAAGVSAIRLITVPTIAGLVLGAVLVGIGNPIVSASIRQSSLYEDQFRSTPRSLLSVGGGGVWLRQGDPEGQTVIRAARATPDGTALNGVMLHRFDRSGQLYARIDATAARLGDGQWTLSAASRWQLMPDGSFARTALGAELQLPTDLTSAQILDSFSPPEMIAFWQLPGFVRQIEDAGFSGLRHRLHFESELATPVLSPRWS
jgi:lipopolysaccharide export system permease protein